MVGGWVGGEDPPRLYSCIHYGAGDVVLDPVTKGYAQAPGLSGVSGVSDLELGADFQSS